MNLASTTDEGLSTGESLGTNETLGTRTGASTDETIIAGKSAKYDGKKRLRNEMLLLVLVPIALVLYLFVSHPFRETLVSRSINLSKYTSSQRLNFLTAAKALDGAVIKPHSVFSFNGRVGPRQSERGFVPAPGYLAGQKQSTTGGGICLVSSTLYQEALVSGLEIVERTPHTNTVSSVSPGFDATVWYGRADLKFRNPYDAPVAIFCQEDGDTLSICLNSDIATKIKVASRDLTLRRCQIAAGGHNNNMMVEVYIRGGGSEHLISRDRYHVSQ